MNRWESAVRLMFKRGATIDALRCMYNEIERERRKEPSKPSGIRKHAIKKQTFEDFMRIVLSRRSHRLTVARIRPER